MLICGCSHAADMHYWEQLWVCEVFGMICVTVSDLRQKQVSKDVTSSFVLLAVMPRKQHFLTGALLQHNFQ